MSDILDLLQEAHKAANAKTSADPRMSKVLGHLNQAIGVLSPEAAGKARAATTAQPSLPRGRFSSTPPPRKRVEDLNKYNIIREKKDVAPAVKQLAQEQDDKVTSDILEAKAASGQLTTNVADLSAQLIAMTPQQITTKYKKTQLINIAKSINVDVTDMKTMQMAAAIKTKLAAK